MKNNQKSPFLFTEEGAFYLFGEFIFQEVDAYGKAKQKGSRYKAIAQWQQEEAFI